MNVLRSDFLPKNKKSNIQRSKNPINYLSGYQAVNNASAMWFFQYSSFTNAPVENAMNIFSRKNNDSSAKETDDSIEESNMPVASTSKETDDSHYWSTNHEDEDLGTSVTFSPRNMFQDSPKRIENNADASTTDTSAEFQKLMHPFHSVLRLSDSSREGKSSAKRSNVSDQEVDDFENGKEIMDESVFKHPNSIQERTNETTDSSKDIINLLQDTTSSSKNQSKQYSIFDLQAPRSQRKTVRNLLDAEKNENRLLPPISESSKNNSSNETNSRESSTSSSSSRQSADMKTPKVRTGKSPRTPGSGRGNSDSDMGSFILAITEGRGHARGEVGIAAMDPKRPHLILCQISDNQRYIHSLTKMNIFDFVEVIVPNTFVETATPSKLYTDIRSRFPTVTLTSVQRRHFSETIGIELIKQYCSSESASVMVLLRDKFYALSAAAALIKYVEFTQNVRLAPKSVKVEYQGTEDTMIIDLDTANRLELVLSVSNPQTNLNNSLLGVVRHCHTKGGVRLLRANILQPPCSVSKIETRLNCVSELVDNPMLFYALEAAVVSFANVENLLSLCMHAPQQDGLRVAEYQLKYTLLLKTMLELLPVLSNALEDAKSDYFCEVRENLGDVRYQRILDRILETVFENAKTVKGSVSTHLHGCFAVKPGINALLDITKKTYCEIVQEISDYIDSLKEKYDLPVRMSFSVSKGFHIQLSLAPGEKMKESDLPKEFILVQKSRSTFSFYTTELVAMDQRSQTVLKEIQSLTNIILCELLTDIRKDIGCLFNLCEYIAELDVIISFAHVGSGTNYVRPKFGDKLDLKESRHPILDVIHDGKIVPNDAFADNGKNFMILTGPNQSGKSIYLRQIALLQIMAQIGCYVPAAEARFRITDRIFSRIGFDDSIEGNASTLIVEMRDVEFMRQNITSSSLIIVDELCRGTSVTEGTTLAFAVCEELLDSSAFVVFATHYLFLTKLEELYYNVVNYNFETNVETTKTGKPMLQFTHKRMPGVTKAEQYGLQVAELTSFPSDVLAKAKEISKELLKERKPFPEVQGLVAKYEMSLQMRKELSEFEPDRMVWEEMEPVIRRYKDLYSNFTDSEEGVEETFAEFATQRNEDSQETCVFDSGDFKRGEKSVSENSEGAEKLVSENTNQKSPSEDYDTFSREINHGLAEEKENFIPDRKSISPGEDRLPKEKKMDMVVLAKNIKKKTLKRLSEKRSNEKNKKRLKGTENASETSGINDDKKTGFTSPVITNRHRIKNLNGSASSSINPEK